MLVSAFEIQGREFHNLLPDIKVDAFIHLWNTAYATLVRFHSIPIPYD